MRDSSSVGFRSAGLPYRLLLDGVCPAALCRARAPVATEGSNARDVGPGQPA